MESLVRPIYQERTSDPNTLGVLIIEKTKPVSPVTENFDSILLIIVKDAEKAWYVKHYELDEDKDVALHIVRESLLTKWIDQNENRIATEWIVYGRIIFDRNGYMAALKDQLRSFPEDKRDHRKLIELGKLIKSYHDVRDLYDLGHYKDAYSRMVHCLHYIARLAVVEKGYLPEITVWDQVKNLDPEVYKLYNELIGSSEELKKRIELLLLATDMLIHSRTKIASKYLIDVMQTKNNAWTYSELKEHPLLYPYELNLTTILAYLVEKDIIHIERRKTKGEGVYKRVYKVNNA
ncbi:nucleotidyltransferase-like protein [Oceanobacillus halotolerans]|uniref:nucleotidyltransferase-like protein n=1 Tax=Oceanobacillus halotolerans TaxID=2663380 RepID=UPI0013DB6207|nr:nucleotidyltransferase-like protein [Oceanobacillus halotolerans]